MKKELFKKLMSISSEEEFTFIMLPNNAALAYKFRFSKKQWIVPYAEGGLGAFLFSELRDDGEPPLGRHGLAFNLHAVGGVAFSLRSFDEDATHRLDRDHGINNMWFTADIRQIIGISGFDITSTVFNGGITFQF